MPSPSKQSVFLVLFVGLAFVAIQLAGPVPVGADEDGDVVLSIKDEIHLEELLRSVGKVLDRPLVWDPADKQIRGKRVQGAIDIRAGKGDLLPAVRSLLTFYELVIIPVGPRSHQVLLVMDARRTTSILKLKAEPIELNEQNLEKYGDMDGLYVTTMIRAPHLDDLRGARNALTRVVTGQNIGNVTEVPEARAFIVTDFAPNVVAVYRLVQNMDDAAKSKAAEPASRVFRAIPLKHARAATAAGLLTPLFTPTATPVPAGTVQPAAASVRVMADDRTNQILVTGSQGDVEQVLEAISTIDVPAPAPKVAAHVIHLDNLRANEMANELSAMIGRSPLLWTGPSGRGSRPSIVASQRINALLVSAEADAIEDIRRLVQELDERADDDEDDADK